ncbi:MAG: prepilin-type N-terminal cleavage/methylation domain-containing protein [Tenericutes bacterium]|nr:prepilin-type N-terminal cleavage/methylation domain-containing protein [Mycoplasmatota bacterium]
MKKNNKGFTLIELLAVILILGIIALIAIPTVNSILKESRTGAWKSTASQMTKAAENYFQLKQIKNQDYVVDFKTGKASNNKFFTDKGQTSAAGDAALNLGTSGNKEKVYSIMLESLSLKGDIPKFDEIDLFQIDTNGAVALAFSNTNAYCMTVDGNADFTAAEYNTVKNNAATGSFNASGLFATAGESPVTTKLKIGGTAVCVSK